MRDEPMSPQEVADYAAEIAIDNWKFEQAERAYYRERELDMFFGWYYNDLDSIIRRDPSDAYEQFHERRLGLGLTEEECETEKTAYLQRKEQRAYQQERAEEEGIFF